MKIAFFTTEMGAGGVEKALINLLKKMEPMKEKHEIFLYVLKENGKFAGYVPAYVVKGKFDFNTKEAVAILENHKSAKRMLYESVVKNKFGNVFGAIKKAFRYYLRNDKFYFLEHGICSFPVLQNHFDVAVCYHVHYPFNIAYVAERVSAKKKIAWIHNDFVNAGFDCKRLGTFFSAYDKVYAVSQDLVNEFKGLFPKFSSNISLFHNLVDANEVITKAEQYIPVEFECEKYFKITSIGRLHEQKGFDIAIDAATILKKRGYRFTWCIVGGGELMEELQCKIHEAELDDNIFLVGLKENPYPYIKACDIYVQPSRHEGYGITIEEARILCKPIVSTNFAGAQEQLKNHISGSIVSVSAIDIAEAIEELFLSEELRSKYSNYLQAELQNRTVKNNEYDDFIGYCISR